MKKKPLSRKAKINRFLNKHPQGRTKFAAEKVLNKQTKRQNEHKARGKTGHKPKPRKNRN